MDKKTIEAARGRAERGERLSLEDALDAVSARMAAGLSLKDAVKQCAEESGISKNELYDAALKIKP